MPSLTFLSTFQEPAFRMWNKPSWCGEHKAGSSSQGHPNTAAVRGKRAARMGNTVNRCVSPKVLEADFQLLVLTQLHCDASLLNGVALRDCGERKDPHFTHIEQLYACMQVCRKADAKPRCSICCCN